MKPKLLLHACCAPCAIYVLQELAKDYEVAIYFYGPNIHPGQEYLARREEMKKYATKVGFDFLEGEYETARWFAKTKGLEQEPERGKRCDICFAMRLRKTASQAKTDGYDAWATVLTLSPHKDAVKINTLGEKLAAEYQISFIGRDWKKQNGFRIACELAKEEDFYRQNYCGCIYSRR
jgi:predicted adenine nucleotide alpha hydrolase (AANH) superfamily ATPase